MGATSMRRSLALLLLTELGAMSLWFVPSVVPPTLMRDGDLGPLQTGLLSMAVQVGFVCGALALSIYGTADRFAPPAGVFHQRACRGCRQPVALGERAGKRGPEPVALWHRPVSGGRLSSRDENRDRMDGATAR